MDFLPLGHGTAAIDANHRAARLVQENLFGQVQPEFAAVLV
jgi:hypothetical protein